MFYSRIKGELDREVQQLTFQRVRIMRPSLLGGERKNARAGEKIGIVGLELHRLVEDQQRFRTQSLGEQAIAEAREIVRLGLTPDRARQPPHRVIILPGFERELTHQVQAVRMMRILVERAFASQLGFEMPSGARVTSWAGDESLGAAGRLSPATWREIMTDVLQRERSGLHAEMQDERPSEAIDRYRQELREAADEIGRLRNTLQKALAATDFVWSKQLIRQALGEQETRP